MPKFIHSIVIKADIDRVWGIVRNFGDLSWAGNPNVTLAEPDTGDRVSAIRNIPLENGGKVVERLIALSDRDHSFSYTMTETTLPVADYFATFRLLAVFETNETFASWEAEWRGNGAPDEVSIGIISDAVFKPGLRKLKSIAEATE